MFTLQQISVIQCFSRSTQRADGVSRGAPPKKKKKKNMRRSLLPLCFFYFYIVFGIAFFSMMFYCRVLNGSYRDTFPFVRNWHNISTGTVTSAEAFLMPGRGTYNSKIRHVYYFALSSEYIAVVDAANMPNRVSSKKSYKCYSWKKKLYEPGDVVDVLSYNNLDFLKLKNTYCTNIIDPGMNYLMFIFLIGYICAAIPIYKYGCPLVRVRGTDKHKRKQ